MACENEPSDDDKENDKESAARTVTTQCAQEADHEYAQA
jgi:hypothetical protein